MIDSRNFWVGVATSAMVGAMLVVVFVGGVALGKSNSVDAPAGCQCGDMSKDISRLSGLFDRLDDRLRRVERRSGIGEEPAGQSGKSPVGAKPLMWRVEDV